jgi:putative nucleotidyltransferase with HDIG domain
MRAIPVKRRLFWSAEVVLLLGTAFVVVRVSSLQEWRPLLLVGLLAVIYFVGDQLSSKIGSGILTPAHSAMVLAMCLLGPAPAVAFGVASALIKSAVRRLPPSQWLANLASLSFYALVGGLLVRVLVGNVHAPGAHVDIRSIEFALVVFLVSLVTIVVNFVMVALDVYLDEDRSLMSQIREAFIPLVPGHLTSGILAALLAVAYTNLGLPVLFCAILVLGTFHYLTGALLRSEERADQLEARSIHLANMQVGVLSMLMDALALRDRETSRHATAVARYAKALAVELGCNESEQETIHIAGLLHDIGKFTWSDRILHPEQLTDADWVVIKRHPQDGAELVGKLDGYGRVADAILYHHERVDGGGYPAGLIGTEIPLASRIVSICSTFDSMTRSTMYGPPLSREDAIDELRKIAGRQVDGEIAESFIAMIQRDPALGADADDDTGYESELALADRVRKMAQPAGR